VQDYSCPKCGRTLRDLRLPGFCEGCGEHLAPTPPETRNSRFWSVFLAAAEFLALGLAILARLNGAPFLGALVIILLVNLAAAAIYAIWRRAVLPAAKQVEQRGILGIGKSIYEKLLEPVLYGKGRSRGQ
jgi:phosphotransferase system  glucose/maltose/N-acetylglucosamine-specific IIC component